MTNFIYKHKEDNQIIRTQMRYKRQNISLELRSLYSKKAADLAIKNLPDTNSVGIFLSTKEEIDTSYLIDLLWKKSISVYLPVVIDKNSQMLWRKYDINSEMQRDACSMLVPIGENIEQAPDFIFVPLVAVDKKGYRIGMGGGFYDRSFAGKSRFKKPFLIGFSYSFQYLDDKINHEEWDIPLDALVNDSFYLDFSG